MEENKIEAVVKGLKCDNNECDYVDMDIPYEDYELFVEQPCPKCGEVILTNQDYETVKNIMSLVEYINTSDLVGVVEQATSGDANLANEKALVTMDLDGKGNMSINVEAVQDDE